MTEKVNQLRLKGHLNPTCPFLTEALKESLHKGKSCPYQLNFKKLHLDCAYKVITVNVLLDQILKIKLEEMPHFFIPALNCSFNSRSCFA